MKDQIQECRRDFLKTSAIGAAGLAITGIAPKTVSAANGGAWTDGMQINPSIDNLRVVSAKDTRLASVDLNRQSAVVDELMDKMAIALAQKPTAAQAWATIFQKPAAKTWAQVKVGFKGTRGRSNFCFTVYKMATELNKLGVPFTNMYLFDSNTSGSSSCQGARPVELPTGINWSGPAGSATDLLHGTIDTPVPYKGVTVQMKCATDIANGTIDILCTSDYAGHDHGNEFGGANLTCKNQYGTFDAWKSLDYLHAQNGADGITGLLSLQKSTALLGTGNPPRLQLALINACEGPMNTICMGTFSPIVDYLTFKRIRGAMMGKPTLTVWNRFYLDFGYTDAQCANLNFVDALTFVPSSAESTVSRPAVRQLELTVSNPAFNSSTVHFEMPENQSSVSLAIFVQSGTKIRELSNGRGALSVIWDCTNQNGTHVAPGMYVVKAVSGREIRSSSFMLVRK